MFGTVGIPLISLALEPADLCHVLINTLKCLESYAVGEEKVRLLHRDISPSNILVSVSKGPGFTWIVKCMSLLERTHDGRSPNHMSRLSLGSST